MPGAWNYEVAGAQPRLVQRQPIILGLGGIDDVILTTMDK